jgi:hypothetical protein
MNFLITVIRADVRCEQEQEKFQIWKVEYLAKRKEMMSYAA